MSDQDTILQCFPYARFSCGSSHRQGIDDAGRGRARASSSDGWISPLVYTAKKSNGNFVYARLKRQICTYLGAASSISECATPPFLCQENEENEPFIADASLSPTQTIQHEDYYNDSNDGCGSVVVVENGSSTDDVKTRGSAKFAFQLPASEPAPPSKRILSFAKQPAHAEQSLFASCCAEKPSSSDAIVAVDEDASNGSSGNNEFTDGSDTGYIFLENLLVDSNSCYE